MLKITDMGKNKYDGREEEIFDYLSESNHKPMDARVALGLSCTVIDIEDLMAERKYAVCPNCGWWVAEFELTPEDEDEPDDHCGLCRVPMNE